MNLATIQWDPPIEERIHFLLNMIKNCEGCHRSCHINRYQSNKTYCRTGIHPFLYSFKKIEDDLFISKEKLLYLYFQHCNLRCVYCIDYDLHQGPSNEEKKLTIDEYATLLRDNIDSTIKGIYLSNVDHIIPHTIYALYQLLKEGILPPILFESNGFALNTTINFLKDLITVYIVNFKFISPHFARRYLKEEDYPKIAKDTVLEMYKQVGDCKIENECIQKGLIVKLLILPGFTEEYKKILDYVVQISPKIGIFILSQYKPAGKVLNQELYKEIRRTTPKEEILEIFEYSKKLNFHFIKIF
ncbi:MAG: radical SAM protein [Leptonema sp. (in: bacteria)]